MKKLFAFCLAMMLTSVMSVSAQRAGEYNLGDNSEGSRSGVFAEIGVGVTAGDINTDLGLSVGLGYRYHFGNGFCWDILKATYQAPTVTTAFGEGSTMRFISAFRYNSAPILAGRPIYGTFGAGYQLNVYDTDYWKGFAYEIGVGVNLSRNVSLGLAWEGNVANYEYYDSYYYDYYSGRANFGIFALKMGVQF